MLQITPQMKILVAVEPADLLNGETFEEFRAKLHKIRDEMKAEGRTYLISADELRAWKAADGASEFPSPSRKSRKVAETQPDERQRDLFSDLIDDEDDDEAAE